MLSPFSAVMVVCKGMNSTSLIKRFKGATRPLGEFIYLRSNIAVRLLKMAKNSKDIVNNVKEGGSHA